MRPQTTAVLLSMLLLPGLLHGQWFSGGDKKAKQEAKALFEKAATETDLALKISETCRAAKIDAKNKKYAEECAKLQGSQTQNDAGNLQSAQDAFKAKQYDAAEAKAKAVSPGNDKLRGQVVELLGQIANARALSQTESAWNRGDFDAVKANAAKVTDPALQIQANKYLGYIAAYNNEINTAHGLESSDPKKAADWYRVAGQVNPHGPVDTAAKIAEMEAAAKEIEDKRVAAANPAQAPKVQPKPGNESVLLADAKTAEKAGNLQEALEKYQAVLTTQPANNTAKAGVARVQPVLQSAADRAALREAIKDMYAFRLEVSEQKLKSYLSGPAPQSPGPAAFYLGAVMLERSLLNTPLAQWQGPPADVQKYFKQARAANYTPVRKYVSPALLKVWDTTTP